MVCVITTLIVRAQENIDISVIEKIRQEEAQHSQVMDIAFHLTDISGPALQVHPALCVQPPTPDSNLKIGAW